LPRPLDIVLSVFDQNQVEKLDHVGRWLRETDIGNLHPRFFVYNNITDLRDRVPRDTLSSMGVNDSLIFQETLPNIGREGQTYLHHTPKHHGIDSGAGLADHIIFCQPHHDAVWESIDRIKEYFNTTTAGVLELDHVQECDCSGKACYAPVASLFVEFFPTIPRLKVS
jgi:hypothetical protein